MNFKKPTGKPRKVMEFWKIDLIFWSYLYFKLLITILEYSNAIKKQKEEEKEKGKKNLRKKQISDKMRELKEKKRKIQLEKQEELIKARWIYIKRK